MRAGSPIRHNTSTLESQLEAPDSPPSDTSHRHSSGLESQPSTLNTASNPSVEDQSFRSPWLAMLHKLFRIKLDDRWTRCPVEIALLAASKHDKGFPHAYTQIRDQTHTDLDLLFDIHLSLSPSSSNDSSYPSWVSHLRRICPSDVFYSHTKLVSANFGRKFVR